MAKIDEIQGDVKWIKKIGGWSIAALFAVISAETPFIVSMHGDIAKLNQYVKDHGGEIVLNIQDPKSTDQLAANLTLVSAQMKAATLEHRKPDESKIAPIQKALLKQSSAHPNLPETWQAIATLVSYRSSGLQLNPESPPDCDLTQKAHPLTSNDIPEIPVEQRNENGYVFRDCTLQLGQLPANAKWQTTTSATFTSPSGAQFLAGSKVVLINTAYVINCKVVLTDLGINQTDISVIEFVKCRFEYEIDRVPSPLTQRLLLASLEPPYPGAFKVSLS